MRIGFIGLGNMGGPMALNLIKAGHTLVVHDVRREAAAPHLERGATWADSPKALARESELVLTSLPGPKEVEAVALGPDGIIHGAVAGTVYADLSTGSPTMMRALHAAFKAKGVHVLDAPESGGHHRRPALHAPGDGWRRGIVRYKDVLAAVGHKVGYMGPIGAGTIAKLVHNMVSLATRAILAEGFTLGVKAGVAPEAILEALRGASFGQGLALVEVIPNVVMKGDFDTVCFACKLARKDVRLATALGREFDVPLPLASIVEQMMVEAVSRGWGDKDSAVP